MGFLQDLWDGICDFTEGVVDFVAGALKMALAAVVWVVRGVFTIAEHVAGFAYNAFKGINRLLRGKTIITSGKKTTEKIADILKTMPKEEGEEIDLDKLDGKILVMATGINDDNEEIIIDSQLVDASECDYKLQAADDNGRLYVQGVR